MIPYLVAIVASVAASAWLTNYAIAPVHHARGYKAGRADGETQERLRCARERRDEFTRWQAQADGERAHARRRAEDLTRMAQEQSRQFAAALATRDRIREAVREPEAICLDREVRGVLFPAEPPAATSQLGMSLWLTEDMTRYETLRVRHDALASWVEQHCSRPAPPLPK